jgi:hypothetical protein
VARIESAGTRDEPITAHPERTAVEPPAADLSLLRRLAFLQVGLAGQGLTFAAMLVPIVLRQSEQVYVLVFASAVTVLLTNAALLAYPFLFPVVRGPRMARVATVWSLVTLVAVSVAVLPLTLLEPGLGLPEGTFAASAVLTATLGLYDLALTRLVRVEDTTGIGLARLYYGCLVLALVTAASVWPVAGPLTLTLASGLAYTVTAGLLALRRTHWAAPTRRLPRASRRRLRRAYWARSARPAVASLAGGWTMFLPGLVLPGLGSAAEPWAIVCRICGGFATVLIILVAPPLEGRLSRAIRDRDRDTFVAARRHGLLVSTALTVLAIVTGLLLAVYATDADGEWLVPIAVASVLLWGSVLVGTTINRLPNFLGRDSARLAWDAGRAVLVTAAYLATEGVTRLIVIGALLTTTGLLLLPMSRWRDTRT